MNYTWTHLGFILLLYAFLGWCVETIIYAIQRRGFTNVGFLSLPFILSHGIIMVNLVVALPTLGNNLAAQYILTLVVTAVINRVCNFNLHRLSPETNWPKRNGIFGGSLRGFTSTMVLALIYLLTFLIFHPLVIFLLPLIPVILMRVVVIVLLLAILTDMILAIITIRHGDYQELVENGESAKFAGHLSTAVWKRIQKTYPGIRDMTDEEEREAYTFAEGISPDKLIWVFLISALLGDLIETLYVRAVSGVWMNRSSVLYGPFSFVWGIGAVVLTITLSPLAKKNDRWVFLGGFLIGGAYEYLCSVFTELVFGTVFWDYSSMPLNIGGRTNVLFMFFWGLLSVIWIKLIYPRMSRLIEKLPPVMGKVITWAVVAAMILNGGLTAMAMLRYSVRRNDPEPHSMYDSFMDNQYPDALIEQRWPNMIVVTGD